MGAGYVRCVVTEEIYPIVSAAVPEAVFLILPKGESGTVSAKYTKEIVKAAKKSQAVLVGCGSKLCKDTESILQSLIFETQTPLVIDADGINALAKHIDILKEATAPIILTPHEGEMARLTGKTSAYIREHREDVAQGFAEEYGTVTVLKGKDTLVAYRECRKNPTGNAGMAVAGSGDVLTGMIASLLSQGTEPFDAALAGVYLHGLAADLAKADLIEYSLLPTDIIDYIPKALRSILEK